MTGFELTSDMQSTDAPCIYWMLNQIQTLTFQNLEEVRSSKTGQSVGTW